ncbi:MAG: YebC/PmpR family DNA-binding transcriptional regulator [Deltaproteobacteria bacterium]|nr:YebC/PmpR family DNA-binding transcriptional regulator [Deltaproteobacteria bacterium]
MSGHNKWSSIKHRKGAQDAKRGKVFTKISKELTVAARIGGGDPSGNPRLRLALANARAASMPSDTVTRAIKKGTGELGADQIQEMVYEGYGPGGVAFIVEVASDNANRTSSEVRNLFEKSGGNLAKSGAVSFLFNRRGMVRYDAAKYTEEKVMEAALEAGAEDVVAEGDHVVVYTEPARFHAVKEALDAAGLEALAAELTMVPTNTVACKDEDLARRTMKLMEKLEDQEDVQNVYANFDIPESLMAQLHEG